MKVLDVSQVNRYIKELFSQDLLLNSVWVKGEISNFKRHSSGHLYFTLKDDKCTLKCVMFQMQATRLRFVLSEGMKVRIAGRISIFERDGQYQLYCEEIQPDGLGALYASFEQLKAKLEEEGLFSQIHKKKLPGLPTKIAIVTSKTGAVIRDIINVSTRRFPKVNLLIFPVSVQGNNSAREIANAIKIINETNNADVIIIARGGGSLEDLWSFNEEVVARAIFNSKIPIVSAVGHETDYTIADLVADLRAPTPSIAAELVVPDIRELQYRISMMRRSLSVSIASLLAYDKNKLDRILGKTPFVQPLDKIYQLTMILEQMEKSITRSVKTKMVLEKNNFSNTLSRIGSLNPLSILSRGYCVAQTEDNRVIKSVNNINKNDKIGIKFIDGKAICVVVETEEKNEKR